MKRLLLLLVVLGLLGGGLWLGLSNRTTRPGVAIGGLLPRDTLAVLHLPDLNRTRAQWKETDIYALWREPAVQDFLQKPLSRSPDTMAPAQRLQELEPLEVKDAFLAVIPIGERQLRVLGGFRFKGDAQDVEKLIGPWRAQFQQELQNATRETVQHHHHRIEVLRQEQLTQATVYAEDWFLAGNDLPALQALLDRLDERNSDAATALTAEEDYISALRRMPGDYAAFVYARVERFIDHLGQRREPDAAVQRTLWHQVRSIAAATKFENGKIRDVLFLGMPKSASAGELTRQSLSLTTSNSFLYIASMIPAADMPLTSAPPLGAAGIPAAVGRLLATLAEKGVTREEWNSTFGSELSLIGDWQPEVRLPSVLATVPVKDSAKAVDILRKLAAPTDEENAWTTTERDGVQYFTQAPRSPVLPIAPTFAISDQLFVGGLDAASVEAAMQRARGRANSLGTAEAFATAQRQVPAAKHSFTYVDLPLLYTRLDAAVRPMLIMAAAFMPGIAERVDLSRLPPPEVVVRHLSPIVISQSYDTDGYIVASVGPISVYGAAIGIAAASGAATDLYRRQMQDPAPPPATPSATAPAAPATETPQPEELTPTPAPDEQVEPSEP